jgi:hypothetical protein
VKKTIRLEFVVIATLLGWGLVAPAMSLGQSQAVGDIKGLPKDLVVSAPPKGHIVSPQKARPGVKVGDRITVTGRVGGSAKPFVDSRAVFTIVGEELPACDDRPDHTCPQPWDFCCEQKSDVVRASATIQILDEKKRHLKVGMKGKAGLKELAEVTVTGIVAMVDDKTMLISAELMYVAPALPAGVYSSEEISGSQSVIEVKSSAKAGEQVVIRGRIGGVPDSVREGQASFTLVSPELGYEAGKEEAWLYPGVGAETVAAHACTVQFADANGKPLAVELRGRHGLKPGAEVVVKGKVARNESGELVVSATQYHVK